jgi:hypothetical protein
MNDLHRRSKPDQNARQTSQATLAPWSTPAMRSIPAAQAQVGLSTHPDGGDTSS